MKQDLEKKTRQDLDYRMHMD
uniref:BES1/BZR1 homolog protein 4 isoform X1 n=1 Tax=Rhizophora mucronata TaxID=61149 RepID=A0A2P2N138_RHIMU